MIRLFQAFLSLACLSCASNQPAITLSAGDSDRDRSIVRFTPPDGLPLEAGAWELVNGETGVVAMQQVSDAEATFILDVPLPAGEERRYFLRPAAAADTTMRAVRRETDLELRAGEAPILTYNLATDCPPDQPEYYCRSGHIHPLRSPAGAIVTDGFPKGHVHQHGLFFAWVSTTFRGDGVDFWNQQNETGTVVHKALTHLISGSVFTGFSAQLQQISLKHGPVLDETWDLQAYDLGDVYILDLVVEQQNSTRDTLFLNQYHYGGLGVRGSRLWNQADSGAYLAAAEFLTSEGGTRIDANHSRPRWTAMYGVIRHGEADSRDLSRTVAGIAVLDHPDNLRHPQPVRVHPQMPYFCLAPIVTDGLYLAPGGRYASRYRIVTFDGPPDPERLDAVWVDFARPVVVR